MNLPNTKLLSEVFNDIDLSEDRYEFEKHTNILIYTDIHNNTERFSVHDLAHYMKEWTITQENCFAIVSGKLPNNYFCCIQYKFSWLGTDAFEKYFRSNTELEAITKGCEWMLNERI